MSLEEYLQLINENSPSVRKSVVGTGTGKKKRVGKKDPKMAKALAKANSMGRKKDKSLRKGWNQRKIMKKAHQLRRKM